MDVYESSWAYNSSSKPNPTCNGVNASSISSPKRVTEGREQNDSAPLSPNPTEQRAVTSLNPFDEFDLNQLYLSPSKNEIQPAATLAPAPAVQGQLSPHTTFASHDPFAALAEPTTVPDKTLSLNQHSAVNDPWVQTSSNLMTLPELSVSHPSCPSIQKSLSGEVTPTARNPRFDKCDVNTQPYYNHHSHLPPVAAAPQPELFNTSTTKVAAMQPNYGHFFATPVSPCPTTGSDPNTEIAADTHYGTDPMNVLPSKTVAVEKSMVTSSQLNGDTSGISLQVTANPPVPVKNSNAMVASDQPGVAPFGVSPPSVPPPEPVVYSSTMPSISQTHCNTFGVSPQAQQFVAPTSIVPSTIPNEDPFGVFNVIPGTQSTVQANMTSRQSCSTGAPQNTQVECQPNDDDDFWASMGFSLEEQKDTVPVPLPPAVSSSLNESTYYQARASETRDTSKKDDTPGYFSPIQVENEVPEIKRQTWDGVLDPNTALPAGGKFYEARIHTKALGATFMAPMEMKDGIYRNMPLNMIESLSKLPAISYVVSGSSAHFAGLGVGFVITRINNEIPPNPKIGAAMIKTAARPLTLTCYIAPNLDVSTSERQCEVKYDTKELVVPYKANEWKPKYVVLGGIISKPHLLNMYRSKNEYDVAVKETYSGKAKSLDGVSVKVKQFDLRGARILAPGIEKTRYTDQAPWYYFIIVTLRGYPIKIASIELNDLQSIYFDIARFIKGERSTRDDNRVLDHRAENYSKRAHAKAVKRGIFDIDISEMTCGL